jgi:hypothetical protein
LYISGSPGEYRQFIYFCDIWQLIWTKVCWCIHVLVFCSWFSSELFICSSIGLQLKSHASVDSSELFICSSTGLQLKSHVSVDSRVNCSCSHFSIELSKLTVHALCFFKWTFHMFMHWLVFNCVVLSSITLTILFHLLFFSFFIISINSIPSFHSPIFGNLVYILTSVNRHWHTPMCMYYELQDMNSCSFYYPSW